MINKLILILLISLLFTSCSVHELETRNIVVETEALETTVPTVVDIISPVVPTNTLMPATNTPVPDAQVCSPVEGVQLEDITAMIYNPYYPPADGSDDPHQGVDFSDVDSETLIAKTGLGVTSIINGQVVMAMNNRFPYGNAILIESSFDSLPINWQNTILNGPKAENWKKSPALTCPSGWDLEPESTSDLSLFILYAHLENPPDLKFGQLIKCGETLGNIGMSGNALSPHVHIEIRYGPSSGLEKSMAHYDTNATLEEMSNYCRWRVSGWYRLLDPISLLLQQ
jgi:murein DD-endopeptidase MepM/ murein hydrolase activator NlpD